MRGHVILSRCNKAGSLYIPEAAMQLKACCGGRRGWIEVYSTDCMHYDSKELFAYMDREEHPKSTITQVEWLTQNFDFVLEVEVPLLMVRFAIEAEEKKRQQVEAIEGLLDCMVKQNPEPSTLKKETSLKVMEQSVHQLKDIMDSKEAGEISDTKKYIMALQIQRWIHEAGGLC